MGECHQSLLINRRARAGCGLKIRQTPLKLGYSLECSVPARLQFPSNQPLGGVDELVSAGDQRSLIASLFEFLPESPDCVIVDMSDFFRSLDSCLHGVTGHSFQDLPRYGSIDTNAAGSNAEPTTHTLSIAAALISMGMARSGPVEDAQHASAPTATHQPGQQGAAAAGRLSIRPFLHVRVLREHLLVLLKLLPTDVAGMMVAKQHAPGLH